MVVTAVRVSVIHVATRVEAAAVFAVLTWNLRNGIHIDVCFVW